MSRNPSSPNENRHVKDTPKGIKAKGIKAKGIKAFCTPKGIKGPKVLKVVPK